MKAVIIFYLQNFSIYSDLYENLEFSVFRPLDSNAYVLDGHFLFLDGETLNQKFINYTNSLSMG